MPHSCRYGYHSGVRASRLLLFPVALVLAWPASAQPATPADSVEARADSVEAKADSAVVWSPVPSLLVAVPDSAALVAVTTAPEPVAERRGRLLATGRASYYGERFRGRRTASGARFNPDALTAAHRRLPFGTRLRITNVRNGRSVVVRVNDRGPFHGNRIIDLSKAAARRIGMLRSGTARVRIERL